MLVHLFDTRCPRDYEKSETEFRLYLLMTSHVLSVYVKNSTSWIGLRFFQKYITNHYNFTRHLRV
jgi:hypothetical protein